MKLRKSIFTKQIDRQNVQTVWCEYAWKMSVNSKGSTLSIVYTALFPFTELHYSTITGYYITGLQ